MQIGTTGAALSQAVSAGSTGIFATNSGAGSVAVRTTAGGTVTGGATTGSGIATSAVDGDTAITIGAAVTGYNYGINSASTGTGNIAITTMAGAPVTAIRSGSVVRGGINVDASGGGSVTISTGAAVSGSNGILVTATQAGSVSVATAAAVTGTSHLGIQTSTGDGANTVNVGANVTGKTTGISAGANGGGATTVNIAAAATVTGETAALGINTNTGNAVVNNAGTIAGSVSGRRYGAGTITLNNSGTVKLLGSQSVSSTVATVNKSGGVLTGTGSFFGAVTAEAGSFIRPGDRSLAAVNGVPVMGTLTTGNLTLSPGATVEIRGDASGVSDKVAVTGNAVLGGATLKMLASPTASTAWSTGKTYTVLNATGAVAGTFALATDLAFLTPTATYSANKVDVTMARNEVTYQSVAVTPTQNSVGQNLQKLQGSDTLKGKAFINVINNLTAPQATAALETLSGSGVTGALTTTGVQVAGFTNIVATQSQSSPLSGGRAAAPSAFTGSDMPLAYAEPKSTASAAKPFKGVKDVKAAAEPVSPAQAWRIWASVFGASHSTDADAAAKTPGVTGHDWGGATGFEVAVRPNLVAGVALGGSTSPFSVGKRATFGDSTGALGSVYGTATFDRTYVTASLGYGRFETSATRMVSIQGAATERQTAKYGTDAYTGFIELGYKLPMQELRRDPLRQLPAQRHAPGRGDGDLGGGGRAVRPELRRARHRRAAGLTWPAGGALVRTRRMGHLGRGARRLGPRVPAGPWPAGQLRLAARRRLHRQRRRGERGPRPPVQHRHVRRASGLSLFARAGADLASNQRSYSGQGGVKFNW